MTRRRLVPPVDGSCNTPEVGHYFDFPGFFPGFTSWVFPVVSVDGFEQVPDTNR